MTDTANKIDTGIHWTEGAVEVDATPVARGREVMACFCPWICFGSALIWFRPKLMVLFSHSCFRRRTLDQSPNGLVVFIGDENASCAPAFTGNRKGARHAKTSFQEHPLVPRSP
jgi:hypothetical protein